MSFFRKEKNMKNEITSEMLSQVPKLYETEKVPLRDKMIYLHFRIFDCHWYLVEYDGEDLFFGFAILNDDLINAEWGYTSLNELKSLDFNGYQIECDQCWKIRPAFQVEKIREASHWRPERKNANNVVYLQPIESEQI
jgi:hypothetical protein